MARQFEAFDPLPSWGSQALKAALNRYGKNVLNEAALTAPRFIRRGRINGDPATSAEFVIDVRDIPGSFRGLILGGGTVDVFGINGKKHKFELMMTNADNTCVFTAATRVPLIGTIIGSNEDIGNGIQLWGYDKPNVRVFVLTFGLFPR